VLFGSFVVKKNSSYLDRLYRIEEEELSHARLTLHAASALKTRRRKGREETEHFGLNGRINHEIHENHEKEEFF